MYIKLANLISNSDPKILLLVQAYKNDFTQDYKPLCESQEDIFVTTDGYALIISDIAKHIRSSESLSYCLSRDLKYAKPLTDSDILRLKGIQSVRDEIELIEKKFLSWKFLNTETFSGDRLNRYPKERLFITEDNKHCFLIDELIEILNKKNQFYNPYTNQPLSKNDISRLCKLPEIFNAYTLLKTRQNYCASKISTQTIMELKKLAEILLNKNEIANGFFTPIPKSQDGYEKFNEYYRKLNEVEKEALDDYWIDKWPLVEEWILSELDFVSGLYLQGASSPIKFKDLYQSFGEHCSHELGGSIVQMVVQLAPDIEFNVSAFLAKNVVKSIKNNINLTHSPFVSDNNDAHVNDGSSKLNL
jgi:hypothetical protein